MLVCHCEAVHEAHVRATIAAGAGDVDAVIAASGAGGGCGGCVPFIEELLADCASCPLGGRRDTLRLAV